MAETHSYLTEVCLCRLCARSPSSEDEADLRPLDESLIGQIETFLPIQVCSDIFPPWICQTCVEELAQWSRFLASLYQGQTILSQTLHTRLALELVWPSWLKSDPARRSWFSWHFPVRIKSKTQSKRSPDPEEHCLPQIEDGHQEPLKRTRKIPQRLAESVRGSELDSMFQEETDQVPLDSTLPVDHVQAFVVLKETERVQIKANEMNDSTCDICSQLFNSSALLKAHRELQHKNVLYLCNAHDCSQKFRTLPALAFHQSQQEGHEGYSIIKPQNLLETKKKKNRPSQHQEFRCSLCAAVFKFSYLRKRHETFVHSTERPFPCLDCDMKFKTKTNLTAHQRKHTGEQKYFCDICGKRFPYKTSLTSHIRSHEGTKPFQCEVCNKSFTQKGNLKEHLRVHTGEKPFSCHICDSAFKTSSQRTLHEKRHFEEKPWKCEFCSKAFFNKDTWKIHLRRHKGEKPFSCDSCQKSFADGWALKKHQRLHTGERPHVCKTCGKAFSDASNLNKHRRHHVEIKDQPTTSTMFTIIQAGLEGQESGGDLSGGEAAESIIYIAYDDEVRAGNGLDRTGVVNDPPVELQNVGADLPVSYPTMASVIGQNGMPVIPDIASVEVVPMSSNDVLKMTEDRQAPDMVFTP
ncbi:zinc finger protein 765-like [Tigriopus californicus]|uniref:zinc finger protein 765-like n=1 Tax=Tigriopus californicus TaxID=6832 RepID=UPI0027DA7BBE|nr:zinc finger protein 765-like [Tigriopus californicus]